MNAKEAADAPGLFQQLPTELADCVLDYTWFIDCIAMRLLCRNARAAIADAWARKTILRLLPQEWRRLSDRKNGEGAVAFWALAQRCERVHTIAIYDDGNSAPPVGKRYGAVSLARRQVVQAINPLYELVGRHASRLRSLELRCGPDIEKSIGALVGCTALEALQLLGLSFGIQHDAWKKLAVTCPRLRDLDLSRFYTTAADICDLLNSLADAGVLLDTLKLRTWHNADLFVATARHPLRVFELYIYRTRPGLGGVGAVQAVHDSLRAVHDSLRALLGTLQPSLRELSLDMSDYDAHVDKKAVAALPTLPLLRSLERLTVSGDAAPRLRVPTASGGDSGSMALRPLLDGQAAALCV